MILKHILKNNNHEIPIDSEKALSNAAFTTIRTKHPDTGMTNVGLAWRLVVHESHEGKYKQHQFELLIGSDEIEWMEKALRVAKERFAEAQDDS